jgi:hypothetical protein
MMKKNILFFVFGVLFLVIILFYLFLQPKELTEELLTLNRLRDIQSALFAYDRDCGQMVYSLKELSDSNRLYKEINYNEYLKKIHYVYYNNEENLSYIFHNAPGYDSPYDKNFKIWFYYPFKDGKTFLGTVDGVSLGYLQKKRHLN